MAIGEVRLRRGEDRGLAAGGCWVYDNQVAWVDGDCTDGGIADVTRSDGTFLGRGLYNSQSKIVLRVMSRERIEIDSELIRRRIGLARSWGSKMPAGWSSATPMGCRD